MRNPILILFLAHFAACQPPEPTPNPLSPGDVAATHEQGNDPRPHERLNGRWTSDLFTVEIDFENSLYSGIAMGSLFERRLQLVDEHPEYVVFMADSSMITAQFQENGDIVLTKEGGLPVLVQRSASATQ